MTNVLGSFGGEKALLRKIEFASKVKIKPTNFTDTVLFVNISYDKQILPVLDEDGNIEDIALYTDRKKLLKLLQHLKSKDSYKFIMLDVAFGFKDPETEWDSALFATILSMDRIVIPRRLDERLPDVALKEKSGYVHYAETYFNLGFSKYPFLYNQESSLPLKMYTEITGRTIKKHGLIYMDGRRLAKRCEFLPMKIMVDTENGPKVWYNLGTELLGDSLCIHSRDEKQCYHANKSTIYENPSLVDNKYIVIGSFKDDDQRFTFKGKTSGAVINYNAFSSLMRGGHIIKPFFAILLFLLFFFITFVILEKTAVTHHITSSNIKIINRIQQTLSNHPWLHESISTWLGYTTMLALCSTIWYLVFDETHEILITSTLFYLLSKTTKHNKKFNLWIREK